MTHLTHSLTHSLSIFLSFSFSLSLSLFLSFSFSLSLFLSFSPTFCLINRVLFDSQVNGEPQDDKFKRLSGYIEQQNIHTPRATVREVKQPPLFLARICFILVLYSQAMMFSATLRLPNETTKEYVVFLWYFKFLFSIISSFVKFSVHFSLCI